MQKQAPEIDQKKEEMTKRMDNIKSNLNKIKNKIVIISGKGGFGKTTVAVNLAFSLTRIGLRIGILDVDITGPNVVKMLGLNPDMRPRVDPDANKFYPVNGPLNI